MQTLRLAPDSIEKAAEIIRLGGLVAFPTETVYGLGADGFSPEACASVFAAKGRPADNPLILHLCDISQINQVAFDIPNTFYLLKDFFPGALTVILKKSDKVPMEVSAGLPTVAVRFPKNEIARELIRLSGTPIAAPSANKSGRPSPTRAEHVLADLDGRIDAVIHGGDCEYGLESTILDLSENTPSILRQGVITEPRISEKIGAVLLTQNAKDAPKAPGMKYAHYSPRAKVTLVSSANISKMTEKINALALSRENSAIMATDETFSAYTHGIVISLGSRADLDEIARNLFATLREFDKRGVSQVFAETLPTDGIGAAIMNRLIKSAGYSIIYV
ncbi:threonylcarbamoyl-AMP synthase [Clostridia bacterium]|nr:threonylcarbamoyl-AMP synthase [Clostridia bacterium]